MGGRVRLGANGVGGTAKVQLLCGRCESIDKRVGLEWYSKCCGGCRGIFRPGFCPSDCSSSCSSSFSSCE